MLYPADKRRESHIRKPVSRNARSKLLPWNVSCEMITRTDVCHDRQVERLASLGSDGKTGPSPPVELLA